MKKLLSLLLLSISFSVFSQVHLGEGESSSEATDKAVENPFTEGNSSWFSLFGPDFATIAMPIEKSSALATLKNPAAGIFNPSRLYEVNFMLLTGNGGSILAPEDSTSYRELFGFAINGGVSIPTSKGVFNATAHYLYSHNRNLTIRPMFGGSFAYSNTIPNSSVALGGGLKLFLSKNLSNEMDYALMGDFGMSAIVESKHVQDFYLAASLLNIGYGSLFKKDSSQSFMAPFDFNFGLSFSYFKKDNFDFKFALNAELPTFLNLIVTPQFDFFFMNLFGFKVSSTVDIKTLAGKSEFSSSNRYGALIPAFGIYFKPLRTGNVGGTVGVATKSITKDLWTVGAGFTVTEGEEYPGLTIGDFKPQKEKKPEKKEEKEEKPKYIKTEFYIDDEKMLRDKLAVSYEPLPELQNFNPLHAIVIPDSKCELEELSIPFYVKDMSDLKSAQLIFQKIQSEELFEVKTIDLKHLKASEFISGWKSMDIEWNSSSKNFATGFYHAYVKGIRRNGAETQTNKVSFYLDPDLGFIKIFFDSVYETVIQSSKKGKNKIMELRQIGSRSTKWEYQIQNEFFPEAYSGVIENDRPKTFVWDGKNKDNFLHPDGIYSYKIQTTTPRGYHLQAEYNNIILENNFLEVALAFWNDTLSLRSPSYEIKGELVSIHKRSLKWMTVDIIDENLLVYTRWDEKEALKTGIITYNGRDSQNKMLPFGKYRMRVTSSDDQGNIKTVISDQFIIKE